MIATELELTRILLDRDPEAEAEEKLEEEKVAGAEEEGAVAIESGFAAGGEWESAAPGAAAAGGEWSEAAPASTWDAAAAPGTTTEWGAEAPAKDAAAPVAGW